MLKSMKIILVVFLFGRIADVGTTLYAFYREQHLLSEANLLNFVFGKSIFSMILFQLILISIAVYFIAKARQSFAVYSFITLMAWHLLVVVVAVKNALYHIAEPIPLEIAQQITTPEKIQTYITTAVLPVYMPFIVAIVIYLLFRLDFNFVLKENKNG